MSSWYEDQKWEKDWHGNCVNSLNEELKQLVYARKMGLKMTPNNKTPYNFDLNGKSILDIGGGAYSLLLKCSNFSKATVVDPIVYPTWIYERYTAANINHHIIAGENINHAEKYDEVWIYNCLQHTISPDKIISNALKSGNIIRLFEWIDMEITIGHPQNLTQTGLDLWLGGHGKVEDVNESGCVGKAYYGIFKGERYGQ